MDIIIPRGYLTLPDCPEPIVKNIFFLDNGEPRTTDEIIEELISLLGGEFIIAHGYDFFSGALIQIPASIFRGAEGKSYFIERRVRSIKNHQNGEPTAILPVLDCS